MLMCPFCRRDFRFHHKNASQSHLIPDKIIAFFFLIKSTPSYSTMAM
uniref:Uncharacterized protein n=1 Tax=Rhizophora mucronata TaxID=61149 RepID=A0A2P2IR42_RHIMU